MNSLKTLKLTAKKFTSSTSNHGKNLNFIGKAEIDFYNKNGYLLIKDLFSHQRINELKKEMDSLIEKQNPNELRDTFKAGMNFVSRYFLDSGDKIRFFLEADAYNEKGELKYPLKECINKVGHGMHDMNDKFREFSYSNEVKTILKSLGYKKPSIVQSMYILKGKRIGGEVTPHTDNTFLRTTPQSCVGIWVAFDDAKVTNGALYGVPGSHKNKTDYFMRRHLREDGQYETRFNKEQPKYNLDGAVSLEATKGSVVVLNGDFVHFSYANSSENERHAYTLHCVETENTKYEEDNWLLRPKDNPFKIINLV